MSAVTLYPLALWDRIEDDEASDALGRWGHYLGPCDRPFGRQSFGLRFDGVLAAVAVSASTVSATVEGYSRFEVVELARLCSHPSHRDLTRVALRLWRKSAATEWVGEYRGKWPAVRALVSYSNETRHKGDIYRFDGWRKVGVRRGSTGGGSHSRKQPREDKCLWLFPLGEVDDDEAVAQPARD